MHTISETLSALQTGTVDTILSRLYVCSGEALLPYRQRLCDAVSAFGSLFGENRPISLFSAAGRTELGGNHTDHQGGHVLAASIHLDILAIAAPRTDGIIRLQSEGFPMDTVDLADLSVHPEETGTSAALLRGIAARFTQLGFPVGGFDAYTTSSVLQGSGLSSSAAFEVLVGNICNTLYAGGQKNSVELAQIGQYAENVYFGKPCGLMDQMACSVGGVVAIDFRDAEPAVTQTDVRLAEEGHALCILDSGASHANLTAAYAAIPEEMRSVARELGVNVLSQTNRDILFRRLPELRRQCGDRAVLRAIHFFQEDARVPKQAEALQNGNFPKYLELVKASGRSSFQYLQNISTYENPALQEVALTIALCEEILNGRGAVRVHGGGFAGTVQAYVPLEQLADFRKRTEAVLGEGSCHILKIRSIGGTEITW